MRKLSFLLLIVLMLICACSCEKPGAYKAAGDSGEEIRQRPKTEASETVLASSKRNVIYAYTLQDVMYPDQYTAVVISFITTLADGSVRESSFPHLKETVEKFKAEHPYTKVIAGLGGASDSEALGQVIMDPDKRKRLAETTADLVRNRAIDGVDLDWEYYSDYTECNAAYLDFALQLRALLGPSYTISMAGQSSGRFYNEESCISMMNEVLDYISVMTYDFDYTARQRSYIGYNGNFSQLKGVMEGYASVVTDKSKLLVGLPLYGLKWAVEENRIYKRNETAIRYMGDEGYIKLVSELGDAKVEYDDDNGVALAVRRKVMYVFDDPLTVATKTDWACKNGYGGMMAWVASSDNGDLEKAVTVELNKY
ncbi:MAG: glycoside hydrolase family 18 protein [Spirochaetales bacterium]|nr:glycoside hydrolase family 18 protein [Spirochaetales bacterium]